MNKSRMKIVCFVMIVILMISCFVGCGCSNSSKTSSVTDTTVTTTIIPTAQPTTVAPTTVAPTTVKPTEAVTEKVAEAVEESDDEDYESYDDSSSGETDNNSYSDGNSSGSGAIYSPSEFMNAGVINWGGWTWTYYSERILPGEGLWIPGRWTDSDGYVCDENGYVCLASTSVDRYSIVETPFGRTGKVYDSGCAYGVMDVYVNW